MKVLKQILFIPTILIAIVLGIVFYLTMVIHNLSGLILFGWLKLTTENEMEKLKEKMQHESNGRE